MAPESHYFDRPYPRIVGDFRNQIVVVMGGASGIGLGIVEAFYNQGARVISIGLVPSSSTVESHLKYLRDELPEIKNENPRFHPEFIECDVTKVCDDGNLEIQKQLKAIGEKHKKIDVIVDSIGYSPRKPLKDLTHDDVMSVVKTNSAYLPVAFPAIKEYMKGAGRIVVIGSTLPLSITGDTSSGAYAMAKAARLLATQILSVELGQSGIDVCMVSPSHVPTENERTILGDTKFEITCRKARESRPNGHELTVEDVAGFVLIAASSSHSYLFTSRNVPLASTKGDPLEAIFADHIDASRIAALQSSQASMFEMLLGRNETLAAENAVMREKLEKLGDQNMALVDYLLNKGIEVPDTLRQATRPHKGGNKVLALVPHPTPGNGDGG